MKNFINITLIALCFPVLELSTTIQLLFIVGLMGRLYYLAKTEG